MVVNLDPAKECLRVQETGGRGWAIVQPWQDRPCEPEVHEAIA
jgi:hypothetical protein